MRSSGEHVGGRNGAVAVEEGAGIITHAENTCDDGPGQQARWALSEAMGETVPCLHQFQ